MTARDDGGPAMKRTDELGIMIADHPYDRGYFARFNGDAKPIDEDGLAGWLDCDADLKEEAGELSSRQMLLAARKEGAS